MKKREKSVKRVKSEKEEEEKLENLGEMLKGCEDSNWKKRLDNLEKVGQVVQKESTKF